jgi:valyl-tRNA synthetase
MNISPAKMLTVYLRNGSQEDRSRLDESKTFLMKLGHLEKIIWLSSNEDVPTSATALMGEMEILVPMAGLIDKEAEITRLNKELDKIQKEVTRIKGKLSNPLFASKAPSEIVEKEKARLDELEAASVKITQQRTDFDNLEHD